MGNNTSTEPASNAVTVTASDSADLPDGICRALNVSVSGNVSVITETGNTVTVYIAAGISFPLRCSRVRSTGTSAGTIVALY